MKLMEFCGLCEKSTIQVVCSSEGSRVSHCTECGGGVQSIERGGSKLSVESRLGYEFICAYILVGCKEAAEASTFAVQLSEQTGCTFLWMDQQAEICEDMHYIFVAAPPTDFEKRMAFELKCRELVWLQYDSSQSWIDTGPAVVVDGNFTVKFEIGVDRECCNVRFLEREGPFWHQDDLMNKRDDEIEIWNTRKEAEFFGKCSDTDVYGEDLYIPVSQPSEVFLEADAQLAKQRANE